MEYKKIKEKNYTLHLINSNRFKSINVVVFLTKKFNKKDITFGSMLCKNMVYTSKKYNTKNKIVIVGEELYGASVSASFGISGNTESFVFSLDFLNPKYTKPIYLEKSIDFLSEILFNPNVKDNAFDSTYFNITKKDTISSIISKKDKPNSYAKDAYASIMYKGTPTSYSSMPSLEEVNLLTEESLYEEYTHLFNGDYKIDIAVYGEIDDTIEDIIKNKFKHVKGNNDKLDFYIKHKYDTKVQEKIDTLPYNQSKLYIGYRLNDLNYHELNHVLRVYNTILGTMNDSILFNVVRENNSLCYSIGSYYSKYNPSLTIYAGINKINYEKTVELIKECVESMKDKNTIERLFTSAKKTINTFLNNYYDDVTAQINTYYQREFDSVEDIETLRENIEKVTIDEVINLNDKISLSTIYLLKGDN